MKRILKYRTHIILYFLFLGITMLNIVLLWHCSGSENFEIAPEMDFSTNWNYEYDDGTSGSMNLPGKTPKTSSEFLVLSKQLPTITHDVSMFVWIRHTFDQIYVDDKLIIDHKNDMNPIARYTGIGGLHFEEIKLTPADSGKIVSIHLNSSLAKYLSSPGQIYLGDRGSFFLSIIKTHGASLFLAIVLLIIGLFIVTMWPLLAQLFHRKFNEAACLGLFCVTTSLWMLTETQCTQFFFSDTIYTTFLAYQILPLLPVPIALFFGYGERRAITKRRSHYIAAIPVLTFILIHVLHLAGIMSMANSLIITQSMLFLLVVLIAWIQIAEVIYMREHEDMFPKPLWKILMSGIIFLLFMAGFEIIRYIRGTTNAATDGIFIALGVIFYIFSLIADLGLRIIYSNQKLEQKTEMKTEFLANMSHEIRTPLNAILSFNEMIIKNTENEKVKKYASNIQGAGDELKGIINSILDISKIETGKLTIYDVEYNTLQMLNHVATMTETLGKKKGLDVYINIDESLPSTMIGDEAHIQQVLVNILTNAVKYTNTGSITFTVRVLKKYEENALYDILFSVKDTGIGIKQEDFPRLFEKYERLNYDQIYQTEGTGLGINIVVKILEAMGSKIQLDSEYGVGSDFYFILQQCAVGQEKLGNFTEKREALAFSSSNNIELYAPKAKILIADDVPMNLEAVSVLLEDTAIQIETAENGKQAIEMLQKKCYDLVLMDHMMPGMDGIQATEAIRTLAEETMDVYYACIPVIALTANAMVGMKETFLRAGMQDFISKPINVEELMTVLKRWLPKDLIEVKPTENIKNQSSSRSTATEEWFADVQGLDQEAMHQYNIHERMFTKNARYYMESFARTRDKLREFRDANDLENYKITVHGLKSTSKMIGALEISEQALSLEEACMDGNAEKLQLETEDLLSKCQVIIDNIRTYFHEDISNEASTNQMSPEEYTALLDKINTAAESFDFGAFMELEDELGQVTPPAEEADFFQKIKEAVSSASFGEVQELFKNR